MRVTLIGLYSSSSRPRPRVPDNFAPTLFELTFVAIDSGGDIWEVLPTSTLPKVMPEVMIRPGYSLEVRPAEHCDPAGRMHEVLLRYQRKLPAQ